MFRYVYLRQQEHAIRFALFGELFATMELPNELKIIMARYGFHDLNGLVTDDAD
jgi:hypothetical protein